MLLKNEDFWQMALQQWAGCSEHIKDNGPCEMSGNPSPSNTVLYPKRIFG
jgi:hypothetical protein